MDSPFYDSELLYRGVLPDGVFWKADGQLSSAAFKTRSGENGISVDRQMGRSHEEALVFTLSHLRGTIVTVSIEDVHDCKADVQSDPIDGNPFHTLIIKDPDSPRLTGGQAKHLAKAAKIVYSKNFSDVKKSLL